MAVLAGSAETSAQTAPKASRTAAADRKTVTTQYGGWTVTCDETGDQTQPVCSAAFRIYDKSSNRTILTWMLGHNRTGELMSEFFVPTEVLIDPGVTMALDDGPAYKAAYVACGRLACKAAMPLDPALASELAGASKATLSLTATNGKVTSFSMAISGVDAALGKLEN